MKLQEVLSIFQEFWPLFLIAATYAIAEADRLKTLSTYRETAQHSKAKRPPIPAKWLRKVPEGLILGKSGSRYFCIPEGGPDADCMSAMIWGGTGSGKTSGPIGCTVLQLQKDMIDHPDTAWSAMICDLKGEIHELVGGTARACIIPQDDDPSTFFLIDPSEEKRPYTVGWDPYWRLSQEEGPSNDLMIEVFTGIAKCFIPEDKNQPYFSENATAMMCGCLSYGYRHGENLVDTVLKILTCDIPKEIEKELTDSAYSSVTEFFLGKFRGKKSEGFEDICSTLTSKLSCFALDSVAWILRDNPNQIGPDAIRKKNVFLSVPDHMLTETQMAPIFRLIISQEMQYLTLQLPPKGTRPVVLLVDEAYAVGGPSGIPGLEKTLSICRGYRFSIILAFQGQAQIDAVYGSGNGAGSRIILDNTRCRCILEVSDKKSAETCISWTGKYMERKTNTQTSRKMSGSISWQDRDIFTPSDFTSLAEQKRVIVVTPTGFSSIQKLQWFRDPHFRKIYESLHKERESSPENSLSSSGSPKAGSPIDTNQPGKGRKESL